TCASDLAAMLGYQFRRDKRCSASRRYAVITAYNGGAGSVLRVFSNDKIQAANIINTMTPGDVLDVSVPTGCGPFLINRA
ncbi:hypothetical protein PUR50_26280, partial [Enterobacter hormaechei subsp. steigerwaltii]|nr:hypothetical protein [Enterobacter hormaechei subsp. steigerwaltii]